MNEACGVGPGGCLELQKLPSVLPEGIQLLNAVQSTTASFVLAELRPITAARQYMQEHLLQRTDVSTHTKQTLHTVRSSACETLTKHEGMLMLEI